MTKKKIILLGAAFLFLLFFLSLPSSAKAMTTPLGPCGESLGPDGEGPDGNAIAGTLTIGGKTITELKELAEKDKLPDELKKRLGELETYVQDIPIYLFQEGKYEGGGRGEPYCTEKTGLYGGYRFDNVEPGTYLVVVWEEKTTKVDQIKQTVCKVVSGPAVIMGPFAVPFVRWGCNQISGTKEVVLTGATIIQKNNGEKAIVKDGPEVSIKLLNSFSLIMGDLLLMLDAVLVAITNAFIKTINERLLIIDIQKTSVMQAWAAVRDASNLLLIVGLLLIAIFNAIRFQIEYYTAKALIPRLVIAAIFINFSFFITRAVIDLSNILTVFFTQRTNFSELLPLGSMSGYVATSLGLMAGGIATFFFAGIIATIAFTAVITVLAILILRVAVLYIVAIFSPLVFLFSVLPFTRGLNKMWWIYLTKYAFMGAVVALILFVASKL